MAKTYVEIIPISVKAPGGISKEDIGSQIKSIFLDQIAASKDLTCKRPTDKNAKSFSLDIDFVLAPSGTEFKGQMNLAMSYWPKKTIFGRAANGGSASNAREIPSLVEVNFGSHPRESTATT